MVMKKCFDRCSRWWLRWSSRTQKLLVKDSEFKCCEVQFWAQALAALKSAKVQEKANVKEEPSESITTTPTHTTTTVATTITTVKAQDNWQMDYGRINFVKMFKEERSNQSDEETCFKFKLEEEEEERLAREKAQREEEANIVSWDNVQAMIDADYQMAQQMQAEEQEKLSIEEKSKLFQKAVTKTRVEGSSKRAGEELEQESSKKQKLEDDKEIAELQRLIKVVPDKEEVATDAYSWQL
ncbi:hypothetical protein Tco_0762234 [Tanacetum coccineum]